MKKLMKTLALALAMCLVLSTAAFAKIDAPVNYEEKIVNVTVDANGEGEQVSLVIVKAGEEIATGSILYVGQDAANGEGVAAFTAKIADETVKAVDIYSGNATYASKNSALQFVAEVALEEQETDVAITVVPTGSIILEHSDELNLEAEDQTGAGVAIKVDFSGLEDIAGANLLKMIWAIRGNDPNGLKEGQDPVGKVFYTPSIDVSDLASLEGEVQFGAAFNNGSKAHNLQPITITAADAIFLFSNNKVVYTNSADKANANTDIK